MKTELHAKLVDLYAGRELPSELEDELSLAAMSDPSLASEMTALRGVVSALEAARDLPYGEETRQRILRRLSVVGASVEETAPAPPHFQFALPMTG